jgi:hypothetical protein
MFMHKFIVGAALAPLLALASTAQADTGSDWIAKLTPPPKVLADAQAQCGENAPHPRAWDKFRDESQAANDKLEAAARAKMSDPKFQQDMAMKSMAASMDPQAAMAQMHYSQYIAGLGSSSPDVMAQNTFDPLYQKAQADATAVLKAAYARIDKCPKVPGGEDGPYAAPFCQKPIDADSASKKNAIANQYLVAVNKAWGPYVKGAQDYFKKLGVVPDGVDPNNMNVQMQRDNIPMQEIGSVQHMSEQAEKACENAVAIANLYVNPGSD